MSTQGAFEKSFRGFTLYSNYSLGHPGRGEAALEEHDRRLTEKKMASQELVLQSETGMQLYLEHFLSAKHPFRTLVQHLDPSATQNKSRVLLNFDGSGCSDFRPSRDLLKELKIFDIQKLSAVALHLKHSTKLKSEDEHHLAVDFLLSQFFANGPLSSLPAYGLQSSTFGDLSSSEAQEWIVTFFYADSPPRPECPGDLIRVFLARDVLKQVDRLLHDPQWLTPARLQKFGRKYSKTYYLALSEIWVTFLNQQTLPPTTRPLIQGLDADLSKGLTQLISYLRLK